MDDGDRADPFEHLNAISGLESGGSVGLERGSVFRKGFISGEHEEVTVAAYGTGNPPFIDLSEQAAPGSWEVVEAASDVYRLEIPPPSFKVLVEGLVQEQLYEDGTELPAKNNIQDVENHAGSFYLDRSQNPWVMYYHPTDSTSPIENPKQVAYAYRPTGVNLAARGVIETGGHIEGLKIRRPLSNRGCAAVGAGGTIRRCIFYDGGKHHTVFPGGVLEDTIFARSTVNRGKLTSIACVWFQGKNVSEKQPINIRYAIFRDMSANPLGHHTNGAGWIAPTTIHGIVRWNTPGPGYLPGPLEADGGYSYKSHGGIARTAESASYRRYMIDGLGTSKGADLITTDFTIEDSVIVDEILSKSPSSDAVITVRNCVVIGPFLNYTGNSATVRFENCVLLSLTGGVLSPRYNIHPDSDHCLFFSGKSNAETRLHGEERSLSELQFDTGAFQNAAWLTSTQLERLYPEWRRGNFRISPDAEMTHADGNVSTQLPDGTPIQKLGPQSHWDWGNRQAAEGPPRQWPTPPVSEDEDQAYSRDPGSWDWMADPVDHRREESLSDHLAAFWPMRGGQGAPESDLVGSNPLNTVGGTPEAGAAAEWPYRSFGGEGYLQQNTPTEEIGDFENLWVSVPIRPDLHSEATIIHGRVIGNAGFALKIHTGGFVSVRMALGSPPRPHPTVTSSRRLEVGEWSVVQFWYSQATGEVGLQHDNHDASVTYGAHKAFIETLRRPFTVGALKDGGQNVEGDIGPVMVATLPPQPEDRVWLYNGGDYRSLNELQNHSVEILEI
jgi:hypothetical protein